MAIRRTPAINVIIKIIAWTDFDDGMFSAGESVDIDLWENLRGDFAGIVTHDDTSNALPAGMLIAMNRYLRGTFPAAGTFRFRFIATEGGQSETSGNFDITVESGALWSNSAGRALWANGSGLALWTR